MRSSSVSWSSRRRGSSHLNVGFRSLGLFIPSFYYRHKIESRPMKKTNRLTVEHLWKLARPAQPTLSPDGAQACVSVTAHDMAENKGVSSLWLLSAFGGAPRQLTSAGEKHAEPRWSPDGRSIAFVAKRPAI